jgi:hypothetical protein
MLGVQQIYTKGSLPSMVEGTKEMGIPILKCRYNDTHVEDAISDPFFTRIFLWYRSDGKIFRDGMTEYDIQEEYDITYSYVEQLLKRFNGTEKKFYLGHWEGDWYLLPGMNATYDADPTRMNGMTQWLNIRQKAIEDARRNIPSTAKVYHYVEMNRTYDAYHLGMKRLVNAVLPLVTVDYVSVSSYDIQERDAETIKDVIEYIERNANFSNNYPVPESRRVFIGEFGIPAIRFDYDETKHCEENIKIFKKFESLDLPFILYWNYYNNEYDKSGRHRGFWVVNNVGKKVKLFYELQRMWSESQKHV